MLNHVLKCLSAHRIRFQTNPNPTSILDTPKTRVRPLFVGIQGPQGSGKSFLTSHLHQKLSSPPHSLSVVVLSIDDLYLPHVQLVALANANPENKLLRGRGQPGTHDVGLGTIILDRLSRINEGVDPEKANSPSSLDSDNEVRLPVFDKSLHSGEGDRVEGGGKVIRGPIDIVILEGWCLGFQPISASEIDLRWSQPVDGLGPGFFESRGFRKEDIVDVNERLKEYQHWWQFFDTFIQIKPEEMYPYVHIYKWRLEQEHAMKATNGGRGMTDEQVESFIDRYIPGYVFFGDGVLKTDPIGSRSGDEEGGSGIRQPPWIGKSLCIQIDEQRRVVHVLDF
ncbi:hypothetical protein NLI96_g8098 [Meripilus lineatus]|uniref:P-loop containing nucleoside triphosphate hydrolase protein n=1 Tax=Meripilus lineatus TaxID=2056292 RepID=A0AAD5V059_9APHY|nr:hypothetical protein NLI96_g8098 [Physisporinus lineatus]